MDKEKFWEEIIKNKKSWPVGFTEKRLLKLKKIIKNDKDFLFLINQKPEDSIEIIHQELYSRKILK